MISRCCETTESRFFWKFFEILKSSVKVCPASYQMYIPGFFPYSLPVCYFRKRVSVHSDGSLNFNTVNQSDAAAYKCVAGNGIGSSFSAEAHLTVTCKYHTCITRLITQLCGQKNPLTYLLCPRNSGYLCSVRS